MNKALKVLDVSYNSFSGEAIQEIAQVLEFNRTLEYIGLAKNKVQVEDVLPLLKTMGKVPFPVDQVEAHQAELKKIAKIIDTNKTLKAKKKPEEAVPVLDNIESVVSKDEEGNEVS